jgi:hypothetical protein
MSDIQYEPDCYLTAPACMGSLLTTRSMRGVGRNGTGRLGDVNMPAVLMSLFLKIKVCVLTSVRQV